MTKKTDHRLSERLADNFDDMAPYLLLSSPRIFIMEHHNLGPLNINRILAWLFTFESASKSLMDFDELNDKIIKGLTCLLMNC